jgi:hypothetical protein
MKGAAQDHSREPGLILVDDISLRPQLIILIFTAGSCHDRKHGRGRDGDGLRSVTVSLFFGQADPPHTVPGRNPFRGHGMRLVLRSLSKSLG